MPERRVFVLEAYLPNGGTFMAYHVARILHQDFSFRGVAVGESKPDHGIFEYSPIFPSISVEKMLSTISNDDVLIANPSFSSMSLGLKCRGQKLMYVQGFQTFNLLDCRFNHYVSVSQFVRRFLSSTYDIETVVVSPFINMERLPPAPPWRDRPESSFLISLKGDESHQRLLFEHLRELVAMQLPGLSTLDDVLVGKIPQRDLARRIGHSRHLLTLSAAEGFGLVPLEAMALGTTVVGFDGFGGRDYMQPGINCAVAAYPNIEKVANDVVTLLTNPNYAEALAKAGRSTACTYTYDRFRTNWREQLSRFLGVAPG